jgi:hypothetical protein
LSAEPAAHKVERMNSTELADLVATPIQFIGMSFYFDAATRERAKELGLNSFEFYGLGRGGTLGDVDADVVTDAFTFFHPRSVDRMWTTAKTKASPTSVAQDYVQAAYAYADRTFGAVDRDVLTQFAMASHKVASAVERGHHLLVDGYRQFHVPTDPVHAAYLGAILMRELRGCVHIDAVREAGIEPAEAIYLQDADLFKLHGYEESEIPEVTDDHQAKKARAEELTSTGVAHYFDVLSDDERQSLANGALAMYEALGQPVAVAR